MAIQNFFTSRDNNLDGNTYVGQLGRLWYNPDTNSVYASDGVTPGGIPVDLATGANASFNNISVNTISSDDSTEVVFLESIRIQGDATITGNISPAAAGKIGGITPGPGANVSNTGLLTIDTTGLPLSFGNFTANNNILTIVNSDEDMILATQGSAEIQLVGNVGFYRPNGFPPALGNRYASFSENGQIKIVVTTTDSEGAVQIIGTGTTNTITPGIEGAMLHVTGQLDVPCRLYYDAIDDYVSWVARRYNGNIDTPTQVLAGQDVLRINATAATDAGVGNVALAQIQFRALEDQTTTAQGSTLNFVVTPIGEPAANRIEVANITVANGVTATQFNTTGNVTAGNLTLSTGGIVSSTGLISTTANILAGNVLSTGEITSNSAAAGIGYRVGAGGTVTQDTDKTTPVTLNTITGEITMNAAQLGGDTTVSFTLNNSQIGNTDLIVLNQVSDANIGVYSFNGQCNSGNAVISVHNMTNTNRSDAIVIRFVVIRGAVN
jgi:hypothetical protein